MNPLISVVVATYRRQKDLENALRSLAVQTYENFEVILVDDNDDPVWNETVRRVVQTVIRAYPELRLTCIENHPNQGSAKTRNIGISASRGEYVTFLDDDDVYLPSKIQRQAAFMVDGGLDYSITDLQLFNANGKLVDQRIRRFITDTSPGALLLYHLKHHLTGTDTLMFSKDYLNSIHGFAPIDVGDEYYLMQRAIDGGGKFGYLPGCDIKAYVHTDEGGLSSGDGKIRGENALYAFKKQYFAQISGADRRYITMRHYAVIAYAQLRRKRLFSFGINALRAFLTSPLQFLSMLKH